MTSKELLEEIRKDYNWETSDCEIGAYFQNYFEQIAKDLEVLDIIKKHIVSKLFEYGTNFDSYNKMRHSKAFADLQRHFAILRPSPICGGTQAHLGRALF